MPPQYRNRLFIARQAQELPIAERLAFFPQPRIALLGGGDAVHTLGVLPHSGAITEEEGTHVANLLKGFVSVHSCTARSFSTAANSL